jgi:5-methylcytosine-specific restriction endonuclease McrA
VKFATIADSIIYVPKLQRMSGDEFKEKFLARLLRGEENEFSEYVKPLRSGRLPWPQWKLIREIVLTRDRFVCSYCAENEADQVDHVIPHSRGGGNGLDNLLAACASCNASKGDLTPEEWAERDNLNFPPWWNQNLRGEHRDVAHPNDQA